MMRGIAFVVTALAMLGTAYGGNWANWRGPEQNGVSREKNLPVDFDPATQKNIVWTAKVGGMSNPIVMNGKVFAYTRVGEEAATDTLVAGPRTQEALACINANTGQVMWQHVENMTQTEVPFHRIAWGSPVGDPATNRVYGQGTQGTVVCLDGDSGKLIWRRQMTEEFGLISTFGGRTCAPALDEDQLFVIGVSFGWGEHARSTHRIFCFDKATGELRWSAGTPGIPVDAPQMTPTIAVIDGVRLVIYGAGDGGVHAFKARTGERVWSYKASKRGINVAPVVSGTRVYIGHSEENLGASMMGAVTCIDVTGGKVQEVWRQNGVDVGFSSPTIDVPKNRVYALTNAGLLHSIDASDGKVYWKKRVGTIGKASLVLADDKIYVAEANGRVTVIKDNVTKSEVVATSEASDKAGREYAVYGAPAIANGRIYLQAANLLYCIGSKDPVPSADYVDPTLKEEPIDPAKTKVAHVQVRPYDAVLKPGGKQAFTAWGFDDKGRLIGQIKDVKWNIGQLTLPPPPATQPVAAAPVPQPVKVGNLKGEVDAAGVFTAAAGPHQGGAIVASTNVDGKELSNYGRVRVFPPLPWKFDFEEARVGAPPLTWLGAGGKFAVREFDGSKVLTKLLDLDLYYRARTNFGTVDMNNITVQADVNAGEKVVNEIHNIPDPGIINTRYVLVLLGNHQRLQIHTWPPALPNSLNKTIPFAWKASTWYTMKLRVDQLEGKAVIKGKVWPRGEKEPEAWTVELEDPLPNRNGNPGLFGHSLVTPIKSEIYYDNIIVSENK